MIRVLTWDVYGGAQPTTVVDSLSITNAGAGGVWNHLVAVPSSGSVVEMLPSGNVWLVKAGFRVRISSSSGAVTLPDSSAVYLPPVFASPSSVAATPGNAKAMVSWAAPPSNGGSAITGYTVTSSPGAKTCTTTGGLACSVTGLTNRTAYTFKVTATNAAGTSPASAASTPVTPSACAASSANGPFADVPPTHTFCSDIEWAKISGADTGYPDKSFKPANANTRAMLASQFYNYSGKLAFTPPAISPFSDVPTSHPQYKAITWLAQSGITTGYADGTFKPNASVNRMSMAAFYYRLDGKPAFTGPATSPFTDVPKTHPFYKEITWLASTGITTGYSDGTYRPTSTIVRMAMAAFLFRYDAL